MVPHGIALAERLVEDGELGQAERLVGELLAGDPRDARALHLAGRIERLAGRNEAALARLEHAAEIAPERVATRLEIAALHRNARDLEAAYDELALALHYEPENAAAHFELGSLHRQRGDQESAIECLRKAIALDPSHALAHAELGYLYLKKELFNEALEVLERAVELDAKSFVAQSNLGYVYVKLEQYERAYELYSRLCEKLPRSILWPRINLGNTFDHTGRFDEAQRVYRDILAYEPNNYAAHWNRADSLLARGEFEEGWQQYRYRLQVEGVWHPRLVPFAPWKGEPLQGKAVVISAEQGLGDQIMFASCLNEVTSGAAKVVLECDHRLQMLFQRSFPHVKVIGSRQEPIPAWLREVAPADFNIPAGSMPGFVRRKLSDFPEHQGYLRAAPEKVARWKDWLESLGAGLKVGLSWRGGTRSTRRRLRSLSLEDLLPVLKLTGCRFVCLQYGDVAGDLESLRARHGIDVAYRKDAIADYDETAALCMALDLTVSVCTSVIHLHGALGKPVWVMVPSVPEWRYGRRGERMPWYPSVRLLRQADAADWTEVTNRVRAGLERVIAGERLTI
jgi:tetratricopeptide (TPR) repeat protein